MARSEQAKHNAEYRKYALALGRFVQVFAKTEALWHLVLRHFSDVDEKIVRALTGGMRGGEVINTLRKVVGVLDNASVRQKSEIDILSTQFNVISEFRDRLIHRGADPELQRLVSSNVHFYRALEDFELLRFDLGDMKHATEDLGVIMMRMIYVMLTDDQSASVRALGKPKHDAVIFGPWRYKRLAPETPHRPKKQKKQARERQPRA